MHGCCALRVSAPQSGHSLTVCKNVQLSSRREQETERKKGERDEKSEWQWQNGMEENRNWKLHCAVKPESNVDGDGIFTFVLPVRWRKHEFALN